jgi:hypothetical protein
LHLLFTAQHRARGFGELEGAVVLGIHRQQSQGDDLAQDGTPFGFATIAADAEDGELVVPPLLDALAIDAAQHLDHMAGAKRWSTR